MSMASATRTSRRSGSRSISEPSAVPRGSGAETMFLRWGLAALAVLALPQRAALTPGDDPALVRRELLARMDARIDAAAARQHLEARLLLDEVLPIPYLGVDSEAVEGGLRIAAVYADTGADAAGIK